MFARSLSITVLLAFGCTPTPAGNESPTPTKTTERPVEPPPPEPEPKPTQPEPEPQPEPPPKPLALDMSNFDKSCKQDGDCTNVNIHKCSHCGCPNTPLATAAQDAFQAAYAAIECPPPDPQVQQISCGGCPGYRARCNEGHCVVEMY